MDKIAILRKIIEGNKKPYLKYHGWRFEELVRFVEKHHTSDQRILDVGNSPVARILFELFGSPIDELGFMEDSTQPFGKRYQFNLNSCNDPELWRTDMGQYDLIIFAEVLEHLYTSPNQVLSYLFSILREGGKLILQTPNAAVLHKRIQLLFGKNPYMKIRENRRNPGHFREYTKGELIESAEIAGFTVDSIRYGNYFNYQYTFAQSEKAEKNKYLRLINIFYSLCPPSMKPGLTMTVSK